MNKAELIDAVATRIGIDKRAANDAVEAVIHVVQRAVAQGEKVAVTGFGVFEKVDRPARMGRNPQTGAAVKIKKSSVPKFRPGAEFKGIVNGAIKLAKETTAAASKAARGGTAKKTTAKKAPARKTTAKKAPAKKTAKKTPARRR